MAKKTVRIRQLQQIRKPWSRLDPPSLLKMVGKSHFLRPPKEALQTPHMQMSQGKILLIVPGPRRMKLTSNPQKRLAGNIAEKKGKRRLKGSKLKEASPL